MFSAPRTEYRLLSRKTIMILVEESFFLSSCSIVKRELAGLYTPADIFELATQMGLECSLHVQYVISL